MGGRLLQVAGSPDPTRIFTEISAFLHLLSTQIWPQGDPMTLELDMVTLQLGAGGLPSKNRNCYGFQTWGNNKTSRC